MTPDGPYDLPAGRAPEFSEYAILILHELRRLNESQAELQRNVAQLVSDNSSLNLRFDEMSRNWDREFKRLVEDFEKYQTDTDKKFGDQGVLIESGNVRITSLEVTKRADFSFLAGKKWVVSIIFVGVTALGLPLINLYLSLRGGS